MPGVQETAMELVRRTCKQAFENQASVTISHDALASLAGTLSQEAVKSVGPSVFPVKFEDLESELSFLALYHLLDFGSGYDPLLLAANRRNAKETIQFGAIGLHLSASRLDAQWMLGFSSYHVHNAFGIEANVEQELQPGITISKPGPLAPLVRALQQAVNQAGQALQAAGVDSLGALVLDVLKEQSSASHLVSQLAEQVPGFKDQGLFVPQAGPQTAAGAGAGKSARGEGGAAAGGNAEAEEAGAPALEVVYLRKAQCLAADLAARFEGEDPRFKWADVGALTADTVPLVAAVLRHLGVLSYSPQLAQQVDSQQLLPAGNEERAIRAAVVVAVDRLAAALGGAVCSMDVSRYLASLAEEGKEASGKVVPHLCTSTTAY